MKHTFDRFGFVVKFTHFSEQDYKDFLIDYEQLKNYRANHWLKYTIDNVLPDKSHSLKQSIRKGIPDSLRPQCWLKYSGAAALASNHPGLYSHLTFKEENDIRKGFCIKTSRIFEHIASIEKDLYRTFPTNTKFKHKLKKNDERLPNLDAESSSDDELSYSFSPMSPTPGIQDEANPYILSLRNILVAFAYYSWPHPNPSNVLPRKCSYKIGYCQSLNLIVGMLLLVFTTCDKETERLFEARDEAKTRELEDSIFWMLVAIVEILLPPEVYGEKLSGSQIQQTILWEKLLEEQGDHLELEELSLWLQSFNSSSPTSRISQRRKTQHLEEIEQYVRNTVKKGPSLSMVTTPWFLTLFVEMAPVETVLRIWDCFFYQGEKILFKVALTIIQLNKEQLVKCTDISDAWKDFPKRAFQCEQFMNLCFQRQVRRPSISTSFSRFFGFGRADSAPPETTLSTIALRESLRENTDPFDVNLETSAGGLKNKGIQKLRGIVFEEQHIMKTSNQSLSGSLPMPILAPPNLTYKE
ncbi:hypothetical protein HDV02_002931 [Globomyces sp. JEL0801]|nr:hypothetical protein HDV02_002931 [Globomyces sp. JEL0801]